MRGLLKPLILVTAAFVLVPAAAVARPRPERLVDAPPLGTSFRDRVTSSSPRLARAAASVAWHTYSGASDGTKVQAAISSRYDPTAFASVAQSYVDFLDSLDHGAELSSLRIYVAPLDEVQQACGGPVGTLACYDSGTRIMTVPGEQLQTSSGVTTSYIVAHEYGHHIAAFRSNAPFNAFTFGPKYWASYERVCDRSVARLLAPGDEGALYFQNPGEAWAETYAHLKYPDVGWDFSDLLKPDSGAYAAARMDVLQPWTRPATQAFRGTFSATGKRTQTFSVLQHLDGTVNVRLSGPRHTNFSFFISSGSDRTRATTNPASNDRASYPTVCREVAAEPIKITVKRLSGRGPFTLRVQYPG